MNWTWTNWRKLKLNVLFDKKKTKKQLQRVIALIKCCWLSSLWHHILSSSPGMHLYSRNQPQWLSFGGSCPRTVCLWEANGVLRQTAGPLAAVSRTTATLITEFASRCRLKARPSAQPAAAGWCTSCDTVCYFCPVCILLSQRLRRGVWWGGSSASLPAITSEMRCWFSFVAIFSKCGRLSANTMFWGVMCVKQDPFFVLFFLCGGG